MKRLVYTILGVGIIAAPLLSGCAPKEQPPATPPALPPLPPPPPNQGASGARYQELMRQGGPSNGKVPISK